MRSPAVAFFDALLIVAALLLGGWLFVDAFPYSVPVTVAVWCVYRRLLGRPILPTFKGSQ